MNATIVQMPQSDTRVDDLRNWSDEELLEEYQATGRRAAFDALVHRYERELFGYLRQYLGDAEMAEDVFQQTFLQVHLKCDQYEPGRKVRPWLYTVATNQAIDWQRRNRRHRMVSLDRRSASPSDDDVGALVELLDSPERGPSENVETLEEADAVRQAIDSLPEQMRQVVLLVYFQGMKYREAADVLSLPVGTVKSRLHAAIAKLSETLTRTHTPK